MAVGVNRLPEVRIQWHTCSVSEIKLVDWNEGHDTTNSAEGNTKKENTVVSDKHKTDVGTNETRRRHMVKQTQRAKAGQGWHGKINGGRGGGEGGKTRR